MAACINISLVSLLTLKSSAPYSKLLQTHYSLLLESGVIIVSYIIRPIITWQCVNLFLYIVQNHIIPLPVRSTRDCTQFFLSQFFNPIYHNQVSSLSLLIMTLPDNCKVFMSIGNQILSHNQSENPHLTIQVNKLNET